MALNLKYKEELILKGQILKGKNFSSDNNIFCEIWFLNSNEKLKLISENNNIISNSSCKNNDKYYFNTPFIINCKVNINKFKLDGLLRVWEIDENGNNNILSYGIFLIPNKEGINKFWINTITAKGNNKMDKMSFYLNQNPLLSNENILFDLNNNLNTFSNGKIQIELDIKIINTI